MIAFPVVLAICLSVPPYRLGGIQVWPMGRGNWIYICSLIGRNLLALHSLFGFKYLKAPEREGERERERYGERKRELSVRKEFANTC